MELFRILAGVLVGFTVGGGLAAMAASNTTDMMIGLGLSAIASAILGRPA